MPVNVARTAAAFFVLTVVLCAVQLAVNVPDNVPVWLLHVVNGVCCLLIAYSYWRASSPDCMHAAYPERVRYGVISVITGVVGGIFIFCLWAFGERSERLAWLSMALGPMFLSVSVSHFACALTAHKSKTERDEHQY